MHILCPHCTTSYAIDLATLGTAGRTVRCSRCKEVWLARPDDAAEIKASALAMAEAGPEGATGEWNVLARQDDNGAGQTPVVVSPSISADWPADGEGSRVGRDWPSISREDMEGAGAARQHHAWFQKLRPQARLRPPGKPFISLPTVCAALGALVLALVVWRVDVVRLVPQAAPFYRLVGPEGDLRGLAFKDGKITSQTMEGQTGLGCGGLLGTGKGPRSTLGMPCWSKPCSIQAKEPGSSPAWLRRPRKAAISMSASSAGGTSPAATHEQGYRAALAEDGRSMPRVLIADDEESMRTLVARAIAMDGHATVTAEDGAEALEFLNHEPGAFDLLLTDIQMPVMDGIALALTAARDFPELTILLMTGFADQRERAHGLNAIVHDVITKPFSVADIRAAVAAALAAGQGGSAFRLLYSQR